jgi:hypothetical protein
MKTKAIIASSILVFFLAVKIAPTVSIDDSKQSKVPSQGIAAIVPQPKTMVGVAKAEAKPKTPFLSDNQLLVILNFSNDQSLNTITTEL